MLTTSVFNAIEINSPAGFIKIRYDAVDKKWFFNSVHAATDAPMVASIRLSEISGLPKEICIDIINKAFGISWHKCESDKTDPVAVVLKPINVVGVVPQPVPFVATPVTLVPPVAPLTPRITTPEVKVKSFVLSGTNIKDATFTWDASTKRLKATFGLNGTSSTEWPTNPSDAMLARGVYWFLNRVLPTEKQIADIVKQIVAIK